MLRPTRAANRVDTEALKRERPLADEQLCHDVDVVSEMRFFGIDAVMTRAGIVIHGVVPE
jgi:hypothetical protein